MEITRGESLRLGSFARWQMQQHDKDTMGGHDPSSEHVKPIAPVLRFDVRTQSYAVRERLDAQQSIVSELIVVDSVAVRDIGL